MMSARLEANVDRVLVFVPRKNPQREDNTAPICGQGESELERFRERVLGGTSHEAFT
jgi:hypothetical protein